jgi:putative ABC transport system substrate-binding protein
MSYATHPLDGARHAGIYAAKILNGAKPPRRAGEQVYVCHQRQDPESSRHVVPPTLLALADEVIE